MSQSREMFYNIYSKYNKKLEESTDTIFSGINLDDTSDNVYQMFTESVQFDKFLQMHTTYEKRKVILEFLEGTVYSAIYTEAFDNLQQDVSFSQEYILENTRQTFKLDYLGHDDYQLKIFEENISHAFAAGMGTSAVFGLIPVIPAIAFSALAYLGINLLIPSSFARKQTDMIGKLLGNVGKAVVGTQSILLKFNSLKHSNNAILKLDNIDTDPEVQKLFMRLANTADSKAGVAGINAIIGSCIDKNKMEKSLERSSGKGIGSWIRGLYNPRMNNVFTVLIDSLYKNANSDDQEAIGSLINFRKCLIEKLVDMYKFLLIANITQNADYKKILSVMKRGFSTNPEHLLSFVHTETKEEVLVKENLITLIQFRIMLSDLATDMKKGMFDVDKESGMYLQQKLKQIDTEIEDFFRRNNNQLETQFESRRDFDNKDFKHNAPKDSELKRNLFGLDNSIK